MVWLFALCSVMLIPTMLGYRRGDAYEGDNHVGHATGMISNMGYSTDECVNIPISLQNIAMTCSFGTIGEIFDYGVNNPATGSPIDACMTNDLNKSCKPGKRMLDLFKQGIGKERH